MSRIYVKTRQFHHFNAVSEVQAATDEWLADYNEFRPHDALGGVPPAVFKPKVFNQEVSTSELST